MSPNLHTLLVANRGEIAVRVMRTAHELGYSTVAVYSDADRHAPHVRLAGSAVHIGPAPPTESYLSVDAIMAAVRASGANAVHPGYGFLAESPELASACEEEGVVFVGPRSETIQAMGRKDEARAIARRAGVPLLPATEAETDEELIEAVVAELGFPVIVKPVAGGGGKGMRIVRERGDLAESLAGARREARAAFGDAAIFVERLLEHARHIEVQVLADSAGTAVHLFERDCSVQRRHQKVVEEAPAPHLPSAVRELVLSSAVALAKAVAYVNAGTVEFVVEGENAYFLEMNTRLQVEHAVTEAILGLDLVALQLQIAAGLPLPFSQNDLRATGHAIEARVYAEDPSKDFLPQAGVATAVSWPEGVRVDTALEPGQVVSTYYDPMLAKVVVHADDRETARRALVAALDETAIFGLTTNAGFLRRLCDSEQFTNAAIDTGWLDSSGPGLENELTDAVITAAGWAWLSAHRTGPKGDPFVTGDGWRLAGPGAPTMVELSHRGGVHLLFIDLGLGTVTVDGRHHRLEMTFEQDGRLGLELDGVASSFILAVERDAVSVALHGAVFAFSPGGHERRGTELLASGVVTAPMPGSVVEVRAAIGELVEAGAVLAVIESMKMELLIRAPFAGVVRSIAIVAGAHVTLGETLAEVEPVGVDAAEDADSGATRER